MLGSFSNGRYLRLNGVVTNSSNGFMGLAEILGLTNGSATSGLSLSLLAQLSPFDPRLVCQFVACTANSLNLYLKIFLGAPTSLTPDAQNMGVCCQKNHFAIAGVQCFISAGFISTSLRS
jgi:hypothetical protein